MSNIHIPTVRPNKATRFRNPVNGYEETISWGEWVRCLVLGPFYFATKGIWGHALGSLVFAILTCGLSWLIYPFSAARILRRHYLQRGWIPVG